MREYVHLHRKALASWVFEDPRRWHFFSFLLMKADERGRVEVSVNDYAKKYGFDRSWLRRCINEMIDRNIIDQQTTNKRTIVTICKYEDYNTLTIEECAKSDQQTTNKPTSREEKKEERERKSPPHPLIKKEKSEKREELSATPLRRKGENDGQGLLFRNLKKNTTVLRSTRKIPPPKPPPRRTPRLPPSSSSGMPTPTNATAAQPSVPGRA